MKPTSSHVLWNGMVEVHCYGARHGSWALDATPEKAEARNPGILQKLEDVCRSHAIEQACLPNPSKFNASVLEEYACLAWHGLVRRGPFADGLRIMRRDTAFGVTSSDCPTVILHDPYFGSLVAAHAGRDSLLDRAHIVDGAAPRHFPSVIDAMVDQLGGKAHAHRCRAFVACGIHPNNFPHPISHEKHGEENRRINRHVIDAWGEACVPGGLRKGHLWLHEIIRRQLQAYGIDAARVGADGVDTYDDRDASNRPHWHSHRRSRDYRVVGDEAQAPGRNLVLVIKR